MARFLVQEFLGQFYKPLARLEWMPGAVFSTLLVVCGWAYFIWPGRARRHEELPGLGEHVAHDRHDVCVVVILSHAVWKW